MPVEIRETPIGGKLNDFLNVVDYIYRGDPQYVRPLDMGMKARLSLKNPFFEHADGVIFTAHRNGWCVGRITAQIDREHLGRYKDDTGSFGFLDTIDDAEVAKALLDAAGDWLRVRGMKHIRGPLSLSSKEELGCLVVGFDTPSMPLMPYHRPYQSRLIEQAGFEKLTDLFAWRYRAGEIPPLVREAHERLESLPQVRSRHADMKSLDADLSIIMDVHNDAQRDSWSFMPATARELSKMAADLRLVAIPELSYITEIDGEPAAAALALPNLNEIISDLGGQLGPLGLAKLVWRLKVAGPHTARIVIFSVRHKFRAQTQYAGLESYLYTKVNQASQRLGLAWGALVVTPSSDRRETPESLGFSNYKTFRVFEKQLHGPSLRAT